jgi:hypothetical protein
MNKIRLLVAKIVIICGIISLSFSTGFSEKQSSTGKIIKLTRNSIVIDGKGYNLCHDVKIFNEEGETIDLNGLKGADKVKITLKGDCVSEIKVIDLRH